MAHVDDTHPAKIHVLLVHTLPIILYGKISEEVPFRPHFIIFDTAGITPAVNGLAKHLFLIIFNCLYDRDQMVLIVSMINLYFPFCGGGEEASPFSPRIHWKETITRKYLFLLHWRVDSQTYLALPVFGTSMLCDRFQLLLQCLQFYVKL